MQPDTVKTSFKGSVNVFGVTQPQEYLFGLQNILRANPSMSIDANVLEKT